MTLPHSPTGPLAGLKVVELGQLIAGPFAAKTLADFGADVVKVEPPRTGDPLRQWRLLKDGTSVWWQVQSRNKRSIALDLKQPDAQAVVRALATEADVLVENFRPGAMEGWGLGPDALLALNPRLVVLRISGYGQTGPYRDRPGFALVAEGMAALIGPVRQEILSGIRRLEAFRALRRTLLDFPHLNIATEDYDRAAEFFNVCRGGGHRRTDRHVDFFCGVSPRDSRVRRRHGLRDVRAAPPAPTSPASTKPLRSVAKGGDGRRCASLRSAVGPLAIVVIA